jgi:hypothetical protein
VALYGAIFTMLGGVRAGAVLGQKGASPTGLLGAVFTHAFQVALLTRMVVASLGVFTSLMHGQAR